MKTNRKTTEPLITITPEGMKLLIAYMNRTDDPNYEDEWGGGHVNLVYLLRDIVNKGLFEIALTYGEHGEHTQVIQRMIDPGEAEDVDCYVLDMLVFGESITLTATATTWGSHYEENDWPKTRSKIEKLKKLKTLPLRELHKKTKTFVREHRNYSRAKVLAIEEVQRVLLDESQFEDSEAFLNALLRVNGNYFWLFCVTSEHEIAQLPICEPIPYRRRVAKRQIKNARYLIAVWNEETCRPTGLFGLDGAHLSSEQGEMSTESTICQKRD